MSEVHDKVPNIERMNRYFLRWWKGRAEDLSLHLGRESNYLDLLYYRHREGEYYFDGKTAKRLGFASKIGVPDIVLSVGVVVRS